MLALALGTLRSRRLSFAGALVAVSLGVGLVCATAVLMASALTASGAGRFTSVDAVLEANPRFVVGHGNAASAVTVHPAARLPASLVVEVASVPGVARAVGDLAFPATALDPRDRAISARGADRTEAHGWASAALTPYALQAGRAPVRTNEVVVDARLAADGRMGVGQMLRVLVPAGLRAFRVSGIARARAGGDRGQSALFFSDAGAAALALSPGQVNAVGVLAKPGVSPEVLRARLRNRLGAKVDVLDRARAADADAGDPRATQREDTIAFLGTLGALAAVIAVFVVASTFAFSVAQRRRELALLRAIGATPRQVRQMITGEALVLAVLGGIVGCLAGLPLAGAIGRGLVNHRIAPQNLHATPNLVALLVAFATGLLIAEGAVLAAAHRAARVPAAEALREAALEPRHLGVARWLLGLTALAGAGAMFVLFAGDNALDFAEVTALLLAVGLALLAPLVLALPVLALSWPLRGSASGLLASAAIATHRRRVGTIAAPVALLVALAGTYAITNSTSRAATQATTAQRVRAPFVLVARSGAGLPVTTEQLAARRPGVTAAVGTLPTAVFLLDSGLDNSGSSWQAAALDPPASKGTLDLGVRNGSLTSLRGSTIAVSAALAAKRHVRVGAILDARLADGTLTRLTVGAIFDRALGLGDVLLPMSLAAAHAAVKLDDAVFVAGSPNAAGRLQAVTDGVPTIATLSRRQYLDTVRAANQTSAWVVWLLIGLIGAFTGLAVVNTSVMATADRRHELALVRIIGATRRQAGRIIGWEAVTTILVGVAVGAVAARVAVARIPAGRPAWHIVIPPVLFGAILAGAAALGLLGSLLPARIALRPEPANALGRPE
jgi:putative ABC transport system permease protein